MSVIFFNEIDPAKFGVKIIVRFALVPLYGLWVFFIHLKLTQFPAPTEWRIILFMKTSHQTNWIIWSTDYLPPHKMCYKMDRPISWILFSLDNVFYIRLSSTRVNIELMLVHHLQRWPSIKPAVVSVFFFWGGRGVRLVLHIIMYMLC